MQIGKFELSFSKKELLAFFIILSVVIILTIAFFNIFLFPKEGTFFNLRSFDLLTGKASLSPSEEIEGKSCDIFISKPDRQMQYFTSVPCSNLDSTSISKEQLLDFGNNQRGVYTLIIFSEETNEGTSFSLVVD